MSGPFTAKIGWQIEGGDFASVHRPPLESWSHNAAAYID